MKARLIPRKGKAVEPHWGLVPPFRPLKDTLWYIEWIYLGWKHQIGTSFAGRRTEADELRHDDRFSAGDGRVRRHQRAAVVHRQVEWVVHADSRTGLREVRNNILFYFLGSCWKTPEIFFWAAQYALLISFMKKKWLIKGYRGSRVWKI